MKTDYEFCILTDENDIIEYEKCLYESNIKKDPNGFILSSYKKKTDNRLQSPIPYKNQILYGIKIKNNLVGGSAININVKNGAQLDAFEFDYSKSDEVCEGINLFITDDFKGDFFSIFGNFIKYISDDLKNRNKKLIIASCDKRLRAMYGLLGFNKKIKKPYQDSIRYFLEYQII